MKAFKQVNLNFKFLVVYTKQYMVSSFVKELPRISMQSQATKTIGSVKWYSLLYIPAVNMKLEAKENAS